MTSKFKKEITYKSKDYKISVMLSCSQLKHNSIINRKTTEEVSAILTSRNWENDNTKCVNVEQVAESLFFVISDQLIEPGNSKRVIVSKVSISQITSDPEIETWYSYEQA